MRYTCLALAGMAVGSALAGIASAQGLVQAAPQSAYYTTQEETQPSPSDAQIPAVASLPKTVKDDTAQKDGWEDGKACMDLACSDGCAPFELCPTNSWGLKIGGWTQLGYHSENSRYDLFNQYKDHLALHQQWLYAEKVADGSCGWDWGFRFDMMYGIDADNTQAFGNPGGRWDNSASFDHGNYGWALPQAYVEVARGDLSVIAGHFYTLIGYEVVPAPDNFFYSHAWAMNNSEPFTHTGVLATYQASDRLTLYGGWTAGWDTGFDQFGRGSNFLGGFSYALTDNIDFTYISTIGDFGWIGRDAYEHTIVLDVAITERLNYVFESDVLDVNEPGYNAFGINQYLFYTLTDCWAVGARVEWWKQLGNSAYNTTFGVNWKPHTNFVMRPEIRYEWEPNDGYEETIFGIDAILTY